jgi:hypothetical protein
LEEGDDDPFRLFQPFSKKLLPCSAQAIGDVSIEDLLIVDRTEEADLVDPLQFLPVSLAVMLFSSNWIVWLINACVWFIET